MAGSATGRMNASTVRLLSDSDFDVSSSSRHCRETIRNRLQAIVILSFLLAWVTPLSAMAGTADGGSDSLGSDAQSPFVADPAAAPGAVAKLQALTGDATPGVKPEPSRLRAWIASNLETLNELLASSGLDLDQLVAQAGTDDQHYSEGVGGPLVPAVVGRVPEKAATGRGALLDLERVRRVQAVLRAVPFSPPMTAYKLNSGFGYRQDPLNRRTALHTGLDFGGPANAPVLATAAGEVVEAGRAGAYGIMVVVDHGMGLQTRYAHLRKALVRVGDKVTIHQQLGIMGRTGRTTGPHLHYEIRLDGRPLNPAPFLDAGGQLVQLAGG